MGTEHRCEWRDRAESLAAQLDSAQQTIAAQAQTIQQQAESVAKLSEQFASVQATVDKLQRHVFGNRSEKITPLATAIRDPARAEAESTHRAIALAERV